MSDGQTFLDELARASAGRAGPLAPRAADLARLHEGFTRARSSRLDGYLDRKGLRRAYLVSVAVPNAARARHLLELTNLGLLEGQRGLDVGAGTGATALALASLSHPRSEIVLVDQSAAALREAEALFGALFPDGPRPITVEADLGRGRAALPEGPFHAVTAGHLLNELLPARGRQPGGALVLARELAGKVHRDGSLVLIEPAQRVPSGALCRIREKLLEDGLRPIGPCTHAGACPVLAPRAKDWCLVDVPWRRPACVEEADRLLGTDRRKLSVSYLALSRDVKAPGRRIYTVISETMRVRGRFLLYLCGKGGRIVLETRKPVLALRGARLVLPADARPAGRDRTGAPLYRASPSTSSGGGEPRPSG